MLSAKPADLVFCAGQSWYPSGCIAMASCSLFQLLKGQWISHVGLVSRYDKRLVLVESSSVPDEPCVISGKSISGVQAHWLEEAISRYRGKVWIARLIPELALSEEEIARLEKLVISKVGTPYDQVGAIVSGTRYIKKLPWYYEDVSHAFCSEMASWFLKIIDRWPFESASIYSPAAMAIEGVRTGRYRPLERVK